MVQIASSTQLIAARAERPSVPSGIPWQRQVCVRRLEHTCNLILTREVGVSLRDCHGVRNAFCFLARWEEVSSPAGQRQDLWGISTWLSGALCSPLHQVLPFRIACSDRGLWAGLVSAASLGVTQAKGGCWRVLGRGGAVFSTSRNAPRSTTWLSSHLSAEAVNPRLQEAWQVYLGKTPTRFICFLFTPGCCSTHDRG